MSSLKVEGGKYRISFNEKTSDVEIFRHEELWLVNPPMSKMLIALIYEIETEAARVKMIEETLAMKEKEIIGLKNITTLQSLKNEYVSSSWGMTECKLCGQKTREDMCD